MNSNSSEKCFATVNLEIRGYDLAAEVGFYFLPGTPAKLNGPPENCSPEEPDYFELTDLQVNNNDVSFLLDIEGIYNEILSQLLEQRKQIKGKQL